MSEERSVLEGRSREGHGSPGTLGGCLVAAHSDRELRGVRPHPTPQAQVIVRDSGREPGIITFLRCALSPDPRYSSRVCGLHAFKRSATQN